MRLLRAGQSVAAAVLVMSLGEPAFAQNSFPTPGGATVPGYVTMCISGNIAVPCNPGGGGGGGVTAGTANTGCAANAVIFNTAANVVGCDTGFTYAGAGGNLSAPRFIQIGGFANTWLCALSNFNIFASDSGTICEAGAGFSAASLASTSFNRGKAFQSVSPVPTIAGTCGSFGAAVGGNTAGTISSTVICAAASTIILNALQASTTGYACNVVDRSTSTSVIRQTATSTTSATFSVDVATAANDVLQFLCLGY